MEFATNKKQNFYFIFFTICLNFLAAGFLFFVNVKPISADEITELQAKIGMKKEEINDLRQRIKVYSGKTKELRRKSVSLENQIAILNNQISEKELDIKLLEVRVAETSLEIKQTQLEIQKAQQNITDVKERLASFLRFIHQEDKVEILEILLTKDSLTDFFDEIVALESIQKDVKNSVDTLKFEKKNLEHQESLLSAKKLTLENQQAKLEQDNERLADQKNAKRSLLAQTRQSETRFQNLVAQLKQEQIAINADIKEIESSIRRKVEEAGRSKLTSLGEIRMQWPVPSRYITAYFHDETYTFRYIFEHPAIDIRAAQGTPVRAAESGFVGRARFCSTAKCYQYIMLIHNNGIATVYGHLSKILVSEDQFVNKGEVIGLSGATPGTIGAGRLTTGPHLHFEVRKNGIPVNPLNYLP